MIAFGQHHLLSIAPGNSGSAYHSTVQNSPWETHWNWLGALPRGAHFQRLSDPDRAGSVTERAPATAKATPTVTAKAGAQSMKPPKLMT